MDDAPGRTRSSPRYSDSLLAGPFVRRALLLERIEESQPGALIGDDITCLHRARKSTRRTRSVLSEVRGILDPAVLDHFKIEFRWLQRATGAKRDFDMLDGPGVAAEVVALKELQDTLGELNDLSNQRAWFACEESGETASTRSVLGEVLEQLNARLNSVRPHAAERVAAFVSPERHARFRSLFAP